MVSEQNGCHLLLSLAKVSETDKTAQLTVEQPTAIKAVIFKDSPANISYKKGDEVTLTGQYEESNGAKELIIDEIRMKENLKDNHSIQNQSG